VSNQSNPTDSFETMLRQRINQFADHAPATVRRPDEVRADSFEAPRNRRRIAGIGATIVVLAGAVGLTAVGFQGAGQPGGADTPVAAVQEFAAALAAEDLLGMIDVTLPEEVAALRIAFEDATREAKRLDLLDDAFALNGVAGVDVVIDGLELTTEEIAPDLVAVRASAGSWSATFDQAAFPFGPRLAGYLGTSSGFGWGGATIDFPVTLVTAQREGTWFVSLGMTVAEAIRADAGSEPPTQIGVLAEGAGSPEAAVDEFYTRLAALDLTGTAALMAPNEGDAFRRYASLWFPPVDEWSAGVADAGLDLSVSGLEYERFGEGSHLALRPTEFVIEGTVPASWFGSDEVSEGNLRVLDRPVVILSNDGTGAWLLPADAVIPATVFNLGTPLPYDDAGLVAVLEGGEYYNSPFVSSDGSIEPFAEPTPAAAPLPIRIEHRDGCTTATGEPFMDMFIAGPAKRIDDDTVQFCGGESDGVMSLFLIALVGDRSFPTLPTIAVVEDRGEWFVSPIGTIAAQVTQAFRDVPDGANIIDMPLLPYLWRAAPRATLDAILSGAGGDLPGPVPPECVEIVESNPSGGSRIIADPPLDQIGACAAVLVYGYSGDDFASESAPVPESTLVPIQPGSAPETVAP
jgi:hypothetical protein